MSERPPEARYNPLWELTLSRAREFVREPEAVFWVFVFPVLLALALGIAFRSQPTDAYRVAVTGSPDASGWAASRLEADRGFTVSQMSPPEAARALAAGTVDAVVVAPDGLGRALGTAPITYRFDPTRPEGRATRLAAEDALQRALGRKDPAASVEQRVTEPGSRYIDFLIPGLIGMNLMSSGMWGIGFAVVNARTRKLLKRLAVTPMRRSHYLLSFGLSRLIFLFLEVAAVVGFGWAVFGVKVRGSLLDLAVISLIGSGCFAGLGLLVAARAKTIEAVSGWMNFVMLPMWLLSGTFFSYERFPEAVQPAIRALPLTALNDALRLVMNGGSDLIQSFSQIAVMLAWGILSFAVALRVFRWQ